MTATLCSLSDNYTFMCIPCQYIIAIYGEYTWNNIWTHRFPIKTHCGLVTPHGDRDLGQHWILGNGLLLDGTKPLPEPMLTHHKYSLRESKTSTHRVNILFWQLLRVPHLITCGSQLDKPRLFLAATETVPQWTFLCIDNCKCVLHLCVFKHFVGI